MARFLSVGGVAFVVDLGLFNLLRFGPGEVLVHKPLTAKILSVIAATLVSWVGNRNWTFSRQRTDRPTRELVVFAGINVVCAVVPVLTLAFSHYALSLTSALADNVATVLGIAVGTALRYVGYKRWVFTGARAS
jgi:putative flippase GtrA